MAASVSIVLTSAAAFASSPVAGKAGFEAGLSLGEMLPLRFLLAGLLLLCALWAIEGRARLRGVLAWPVALLGLLYALQAVFFFLSLREIPASEAELIYFTYPALVAVAGRLLFGGPLTSRTLVALAASGFGTLLVVGGGEIGIGAGLAFGLAAPTVYAAYLLSADRITGDVSTLTLSVGTLLGAVPWLALGTALAGAPPATPSSFEGLGIIGLLLIGPMVGIPMLMIGMSRLGVTPAAIIGTCEPVFALILAVLFLGESPTSTQFLGAAFVVGAVPLAVSAGQMRSVEAAGSGAVLETGEHAVIGPDPARTRPEGPKEDLYRSTDWP